jgi:hypothetical protein
MMQTDGISTPLVVAARASVCPGIVSTLKEEIRENIQFFLFH